MLNWRYDSGEVAGHAPFATDTTTPVDLTGLTGDQQAQIGLFCGSTFATLIAPRNLFDAGLGLDNIFRKDRYKTNLRFTAVNLTNKEALYNFLSTFSGTHFVAPRTYQGQVEFNF